MNKKYLAAAILATGAAILPLASSASAATTTESGIFLTAEATTRIDVTAPNKVVFTAQANENWTDEQTITFSNAATTGAQVKVKTLQVQGTNGYTAVPYANDFNEYARDAKQFAVAITKVGTTVQSQAIDLYNVSNRSETINAGSTQSYTLKAKTTTVSTDTTELLIGKLVATFDF